MLKKSLLSLFLVLVITLTAGVAFAANSLSWVAPADQSTYCVGEIVNPQGSAGAPGGLDLALVIDESGSMVGSGITAAKNAATALVNALPANTTSVAVIGFNSSANTYRVLSPLSSEKTQVIAAINSLTAGGGTNIGSGITESVNTLLAGNTAGRTMMEVVLSDGFGSYSGQAAAAYNNYGIITHTVGIPGHNATLMANIANDGNGVYTNVSDLSQLEAIFDGTAGNLVGLDYIDVELPDGTILSNIAFDGLGNFILPDWAIALGAQTFTAKAYFKDGDVLTAALTLNGRDCQQVPEPTTIALLGIGLLGLAGVSRKKIIK